VWRDRWAAISARVAGLLNAGNLMALTFAGVRTDDFGIGKRWIVPELEALKVELEQFAAEHSAALPEAAGVALKRFLESAVTGRGSEGSATIQAIVPLAVFRSEFEYLVQDRDLEGRALTELAFEHLTRLLAVDRDVRTKWTRAFESHETHCERLGAVHLLSHGIWGFKISSAGAATDLVFPAPIDGQVATVRRTARALVLTEWKLVKTATQLEEKAAEARRQAQLYSAGVLSDMTLKSTRYIVLVSRKQLLQLDDAQEAGVTYRHVVIPVDPDPPSTEARATERRMTSRPRRVGDEAQSD
jgi:hypothetical protein